MTDRLNGPESPDAREASGIAAREDLAALRQHGPLTHCLTNVVAAQVSANVLLALGASVLSLAGADGSESGGEAGDRR